MSPIDALSGTIATQAVQFLAVTSLKTSALLLFTLIWLRLSRRSPASLRHWILTLALVSTLILPVLAWFSPAWSLAILPGVARSDQLKNTDSPDLTAWTITGRNQASSLPVTENPTSKTSVNNGAKTVVPKLEVETVSPQVTALSSPTYPSSSPARANDISPAILALGIWLAGAAVVLLHWMKQYGAVWRITRRGTPADAAWTNLLNAQRSQLKIRRPVMLRYAQVHVPMTWGLRRPVILLPFEAAGWDDSRRRVVLLHELAHIAHWDCLAQWVSLACCALNWFNPLVWIAVRQAALEREQARDDLVLRAGVRATDYAGHLLAIARAAVYQRSLQVAGLALAQRSGLERRIRGILDPRRSRRSLRRTHSLVLAVLLVAVMPLSGLQLSYISSPVAAQGRPITLSLAVRSDMQAGIQASGLLAGFEAQHPGVTVKLVDSMAVPDAADGLQTHFDAIQTYANSADVLFFENFNMPLTPFDTRAGYVLDLAPLIDSDVSFPVDDFYPQMWSAYQWDYGIWGVPFGADMVVLSYNPQAFDQAGLTYPDDTWTLDQFVQAATQLTVKDANGNVVTAGFANSGRMFREAFWRSLISADAVDPSSSPNNPQFSRPDIESMIGAYHQLEQQGIVNSDPSATAMFVDTAHNAPPPHYAWALLPGGHAVLLPFGFAISAGTQHPELAYDLIKYLSGIATMNGGVPARKSLAGSGPKSSMVQPDYQQLVQDGFDNSLNYNNLRFFDYLNGIAWTGASVPDALQNAEARALADLKTADGLKGKLALTVNEPQVQTVASGKIALSFDVVSKIQPLPTRDQWDRVIQDFTAADPEVGAINLRVLQEPASEAAASSDCYYLPDNAVPTLSSNTVLPLDPLLSADPAFDRTDFINGVLPAVQRNGQTYALPLDLEPLILRYDPARFSAAQIPEPSNTWTVEDFAAALAALQPDSQGQAPFVDGESNGAYLLVLIASYGGLPLDYRTTPPTINFTDPTTVTAIQQVLDLARSGELRYSALGDFGATIPALPNNTTAVYSSPLDSRGRKIPRGATPDKAVFFPTGRQFNGVAYNLGAGYISTQSQNPEACYRFISTIAQHPELFSAMPVRRSLLASAALQAATAPDVLAMYQQVETLLSDPNTVAFPITGTGLSITDFLLQHWLFQAFDAYVLSDSDLDSALADAQTYASAFQTCAATLPPLSLGAVKGNDRSALVPYVDCAEHVDSSLKPVLDPLVSG